MFVAGFSMSNSLIINIGTYFDQSLALCRNMKFPRNEKETCYTAETFFAWFLDVFV